MGRFGRVPGTRELVIPRTPFIMPYKLEGKVIHVLRVFHGARRWPTSCEDFHCVAAVPLRPAAQTR